MNGALHFVFGFSNFHYFVCVCAGEQDNLRMFGAKAERHVILFKRALLIAKKRDDVTMSVKAFIEVTICLEGCSSYQSVFFTPHTIKEHTRQNLTTTKLRG